MAYYKTLYEVRDLNRGDDMSICMSHNDFTEIIHILYQSLSNDYVIVLICEMNAIEPYSSVYLHP